MESTQSTFISSTFWTERVGPTAAFATLKVMEKKNLGLKLLKQVKKCKMVG